ncbi:MAG TPA: hypothetical protein VFB78_19200 [Acidimicrobiales bacterium]|nr:hypothetical protein [Acidimicrobiales bacterium]
MERTRLTLAAVVVAVGVIGSVGLAPSARATTNHTVVVDNVVAKLMSRTCTSDGGIYPTCDYHFAGAGLTTTGAVRLWRLTYATHRFVHCMSLHYGTWTLKALDLSGDSLSGTLWERFGGPFHMEVTNGSGAYAGAADDVPGGTYQSYGPLFVPPNPLIGGSECGDTEGVVEDVESGSFAFNFHTP